MVTTYCYDTAVIYANFLIHIYMNININLTMKRKIAEKKGYTYKITKISTANCPRVANIKPNLSLCITLLLSGHMLELSNLYMININEKNKNKRKNVTISSIFV